MPGWFQSSNTLVEFDMKSISWCPTLGQVDSKIRVWIWYEMHILALYIGQGDFKIQMIQSLYRIYDLKHIARRHSGVKTASRYDSKHDAWRNSGVKAASEFGLYEVYLPGVIA